MRSLKVAEVLKLHIQILPPLPFAYQQDRVPSRVHSKQSSRVYPYHPDLLSNFFIWLYIFFYKSESCQPDCILATSVFSVIMQTALGFEAV